MPRTSELLSRALLENRVMVEMTALAASEHQYDDVVQGILDGVEAVVSGPFLSLSIGHGGQVGHYARTRSNLDSLWARELERYMGETRQQRLSAASRRVAMHHLSSPVAWIATFLAETRTGRAAALALASPEPLALTSDQEALMLRLTGHAVLVLDHALLLGEMEELETTDRLTGLVNQRRLVEILEYEIECHRHSGRRLSVIVVDVEGLDGINRSYGRNYGNHILKRIAMLLAQAVRSIDIVARCGLDEFAVLLPETDGEEAQALAEELRERILAVEFAGGAIGLSIGLGQLKPEENLTAEGILRRAEQSLHEAKRQSRGLSALWNPEVRRATP